MFCKKNIALLLMLSSLFTIQFVSGMDNGPIIYFPMDEGGGEFIFGQNGQKGIIHDAKWTEGKFGSALYFNGKNSYVEVDAVNELGSNELTISAWIKPETFSITKRAKPVLFCHGYHKKNGWYVWLEPNGKIQVILNKDNTLTGVPSVTELQLNQWHHVAVAMIRNSGLKIYVDGKKDSEKQSKIIDWLPSSEPLYIGRYKNRGFEYKGNIDEIKIYNRALTAEEIKAAMSNKTVKERNKIPAIRKTAVPPRIDGEIKNDIWNTVPVTVAYFKLQGGNNKATKQTFVSITYDDKNIYFAFYQIEHNPKKIVE
ncbi:MAG: sialidase domain-containing protein [Victivallaceae bacterium]|nr:sialidase domain-containing protein [Victivallaceae bacterium]